MEKRWSETVYGLTGEESKGRSALSIVTVSGRQLHLEMVASLPTTAPVSTKEIILNWNHSGESFVYRPPNLVESCPFLSGSQTLAPRFIHRRTFYVKYLLFAFVLVNKKMFDLLRTT